MTPPGGIVAFLWARLDDDALIARAAGGGTWPDSDFEVRSTLVVHARRWDPVRVQAWVEALRQIIGLHEQTWWTVAAREWPQAEPQAGVDGWGSLAVCDFCSYEAEGRGHPEPWPCRHVRLLAAIWHDHPGYDPAWAPEEART